MAGIVTNQAQITILSTEQSSNNVLVNRGVQPSFDGNIEQFVVQDKTPGVASFAIVLPAGFFPIAQFYIRNIGPAGSLKITITPVGGAAVDAAIIGPGDVFMYWVTLLGAPAIGGISQGLAAISITGSVAGILYEYFLGA